MAHMEDSQKKTKITHFSPFKKGVVLFLLLIVLFVPFKASHSQINLVNLLNAAPPLQDARDVFTGSLDYMLNEMIPSFLTKFAVSIAGQFAKLSGVAGDMIVQYGLSNNFVDSFAVTIGWHIVRDVANIFFILVLVVIAFGTILGSHHFGWKERLPELIIAVFLVNFSKVILGIFIDLVQILTLTFFSALADGGGGNFTDVFKLGEIMNTTLQVSSWLRLAASLVAAIVVLFLTGLLFYVAIRMIWRTLIIQALIIMAPLAFLSRAIPHGEEYFSKWMHEFLHQLLFGPFVAFFLWLLVVIFTTQQISLSQIIGGHLIGITSITGVDVAHAQLTGAEGGFITYFLTVFVMMMVFLKMAETAAGSLAGGVGKLVGGGMKLGRLGMKGAQLSARGGLAGLRAGRSVAGGLARGAANLAAPLATKAAQGLGGLAGGLGGMAAGAGRGARKAVNRLPGGGVGVGETAGKARAFVGGKVREGAANLAEAAKRSKAAKTVRAGVLAGYTGSQVVADKVKDVAGKVREFGARQVDEFQASQGPVARGARVVAGGVADVAVGAAQGVMPGAEEGAKLGGQAATAVAGAPRKIVEGVVGAAKAVAAAAKIPIAGSEMEKIGYKAKRDTKDLEALDKPRYGGLSDRQLARSANTAQLDAMLKGKMAGSDKNTRRAAAFEKIKRGDLDSADVENARTYIDRSSLGSEAIREEMKGAWEGRMGATGQRDKIKKMRSSEEAGGAAGEGAQDRGAAGGGSGKGAAGGGSGKGAAGGGSGKGAAGGGMAAEIAAAVRAGARAGVLEGLHGPEKAKKTPEEKIGWMDKILSKLGMKRGDDGSMPSEADIQERMGKMDPAKLEDLGKTAAEMSPEDAEGDDEASVLHKSILGVAEEEGKARGDAADDASEADEAGKPGAAEELRAAAQALSEVSEKLKAGGVSDSKNDAFMKLVDKLGNNGKQTLTQHLANKGDDIGKLVEYLKGNQMALPRAIAKIIRSG